MSKGKPITVLLAANGTKAEGIEKAFNFEPDIRIMSKASTGPKTLEQYRSLDPDVVLVDPDLAEMDGYETTASLLDNDPLAQVIFVSMEASKESVYRAMKVGAHDFVDDYVQDDRLAASIREAAAKVEKVRKATGQLPPLDEVLAARRGPEGRLVAVFSPKGGAGVTTVAVNLALALHSEESPAVLVDADLQFGDVSAFLNLQPSYSLADLVPRAQELDEELLADMVQRHEDGLSVIAAPDAPELADEVTSEGLSELLASLRRRYGYIVVDTACHLDDVSLAVLEEADLVVSLLLPEIPSIKNTRILLDLFAKLDLSREKLLFVMNQIERRESITSGRVSEHLGHPVVAELPFDRGSVKGAINVGNPLVRNEKSGSLYQPLLDLTGEVKERLLELQAPQQAAVG